MKKDMGYEYGSRLARALATGVFVRDHRTNHGTEFTGGKEDLYRDRFNSYLGSCGCFLMDQRMASGRSEYYG